MVIALISLVPRPHPLVLRGKRGLVNLDIILGPGKGIWALQWDCSFSAVIWPANHRNAKRHCLLYKFESSARARRAQAALLTNQIQGLFRHNSCGARALSRPNQENGPNSPDPFSLAEGGVWERDYVLISARGHAHHVMRGHKPLQMHGFPIQTYGKTSKCHNFNSKVWIKILSGQISSFDAFCMPI